MGNGKYLAPITGAVMGIAVGTALPRIAVLLLQNVSSIFIYYFNRHVYFPA